MENLICETLDPNDKIAKFYNPIKPDFIIDRKDNKCKQIINKEKLVKDKIVKQKKSESSNTLILKKYLGLLSLAILLVLVFIFGYNKINHKINLWKQHQ